MTETDGKDGVRFDVCDFAAELDGRAFQGASRVSSLSAILKDEPEPTGTVPAEVDRILRRCLRKDPARRFQSMADIKLELDEVREESDSGKLAAPAMLASSRRRRVLPVVLGSLLAAVGEQSGSSAGQGPRRSFVCAS